MFHEVPGSRLKSLSSSPFRQTQTTAAMTALSDWMITVGKSFV